MNFKTWELVLLLVYFTFLAATIGLFVGSYLERRRHKCPEAPVCEPQPTTTYL